ncbi:MAG: CRISPR-associated helicase Cas3' [Ignavibacteriaceae bacterium]|nr:CRISPR-associated helicase Cas3' [Ignavibacteriaceae bacterium]
MKSFSEIYNEGTLNLSAFIDPLIYFAHRNSDKVETLEEHTELVLKYFLKLVEANKIEPLIDSLLEQYAEGIAPTEKKLPGFLKYLFIEAIFYHDFGKINPAFQKIKMNNLNFKEEITTIYGSQHSILSAFIFIHNKVYQAVDLFPNIQDNPKILSAIYLFAYSILQHHSSLWDLRNISFDEIEDLLKLSSGLKFPIISIEEIEGVFAEENISDCLNSALDFEEPVNFILSKLNFSLLTASDYLATNEFMNGIKIDDFGLIDEVFKENFTNSVQNIPYNKILFENPEKISKDQDLEEMSGKNLNILRSLLAKEVLEEVKLNHQNRLYYLEAPTGSGKTNLSFIAASTLLNLDTTINKIFYVFPFVSLITQTKEFIEQNLNLLQLDYAEIHSRASIKDPESENKVGSEVDAKYDTEYTNFIAGNFLNYPLLITSHVKFFSILCTGEKSSNYAFHRLANSIVIIDELQSYSPDLWDKISYILDFCAEKLNIRFILMSATLPKIGDILSNSYSLNNQFVNLVKDKDFYFKNPNFMNRVKFSSRLLESKFKFSYENLLEKVVKATEKRSQNTPQKVLVEFVTKSGAEQFFNLVENSNLEDLFPQRYLISGTILEPRRKEIISKIKKSEEENILVVATQVIEAGVDIDMDIGFKDIAIVDFDEQFAGRINRNAKKHSAPVYLFNSGKAAAVYLSDLRFKESLSTDEHLEMLTNKQFDPLYKLVFKTISEKNQLPTFDESLHHFKFHLKDLNFLKITRIMTIIKSGTVPVFVPLKIPAHLISDAGIDFAKKFELLDNGDLCGQKVFEKFMSFSVGKKSDFLDSMTKIKNLQSLQGNFIFNTYSNSHTFKKLCLYGKFTRSGILYLKDYIRVYSFENGINSLIIDENSDSNFL